MAQVGAKLAEKGGVNVHNAGSVAVQFPFRASHQVLHTFAASSSGVKPFFQPLELLLQTSYSSVFLQGALA